MKILGLITQIAILKTIWLNIIYCGLQFWKFPIIVYRHTYIRSCKGRIVFEEPLHFGMLQIGRLRNGFQHPKDGTVWNVNGTVILKGKAAFGRGSRIDVGCNAILTIGNEFCSSGNTTIVCQKAITFGDDNLLSWDTLLMDTDFHHIFDIAPPRRNTNIPKQIRTGNHVWIGCGVTILKGVNISDNVVVASNSTIVKDVTKSNVVASNDRVLKEHIKWTY